MAEQTPADDHFGEGLTEVEVEASIVERLPELLRGRTCPAGLPHTGDHPERDHGHTNCWLMQLAATEIERLRAEVRPRVDADTRAEAETAIRLLRAGTPGPITQKGIAAVIARLLGEVPDGD